MEKCVVTMDSLNGHFCVLTPQSHFSHSILVELAGQDQGGIYFGISQSVGNAMAMFSGVISGYLSDKFSRKAAVFLSQLFAGFCCLLIAIGMHYEHSPSKSIWFCLLGYTLRQNQPHIRNYGSIHI